MMTSKLEQKISELSKKNAVSVYECASIIDIYSRRKKSHVLIMIAAFASGFYLQGSHLTKNIAGKSISRKAMSLGASYLLSSMTKKNH